MTRTAPAMKREVSAYGSASQDIAAWTSTPSIHSDSVRAAVGIVSYH
jgi:hypothetical protein